jgi:hypothetical protein
LSGTHFTAIAKIEADQRAPGLRVALALAVALGVSVYDLVSKAKVIGKQKFRCQ